MHGAHPAVRVADRHVEADDHRVAAEPLGRQVELTGDAELAALEAELRGYPCDSPEPEVELPGPGEIVVPLRLRHESGELVFLGTIATFGTPLDVTLAELSIESFYPADEHTASVLRDRARH